MADYIDRQAAIAAIDEYAEFLRGLSGTGWNGPVIAGEIKNIIAKLPSPWVSVEDRLPKAETDVLIACNRNGYRFTCPAIYEDGKMLRQDSVWNWNDIESYGSYDEELDDYYIPEGWWENRQFNTDDVYNNQVDCAVTHWMPNPDAPEVE